MAVLENKKTTFGSGAFLAQQQLVAYDLQAANRYFEMARYDLRGAAERSKQPYRFPAMAGGTPLLVDEGLKLPVSLATALQTSAMYQGMNWEQPITRRYIAGEFFRQYVNLLLKEAVNLVARRQVSLDVSLPNLVIRLGRGVPSSIQMRRFSGAVGPAFPQPDQNSNFTALPTDQAFYQHFVTTLLTENLRPLVEKLVEISRAKAEVFWDYAIEAMLAALDSLAYLATEIRPFLLIEELNPGDRVRQAAPVTTTPGKPLGLGVTLYLKRRCCEKYRKDSRCSNCPGLKGNF